MLKTFITEKPHTDLLPRRSRFGPSRAGAALLQIALGVQVLSEELHGSPRVGWLASTVLAMARRISVSRLSRPARSGPRKASIMACPPLAFTRGAGDV